MATQHNMVGIGIAAILVLLVLAAFTPAASVVEVYQNDSIQAAINAATPGETIIVHDGMYKENLVVNKSDIVIRSANGSAVTSISSNQTDAHVVNITDQTNVTLQGFTIQDAEGTSTSVAGLYMDTTTNCKISDIAVTNISAAGGGNNAWGIYLWLSENNTFDYISFGNGVAD